MAGRRIADARAKALGFTFGRIYRYSAQAQL
jgi:hypothetical protein